MLINFDIEIILNNITKIPSTKLKKIAQFQSAILSEECILRDDREKETPQNSESILAGIKINR